LQTSTAEIIEMIDRLPPEEKAEVVSHLERWRNRGGSSDVRYLPKAEAERLAETVFQNHEELFRKLAQ
jgi:predicted SprT family Zn-dependent metalloprotease